MPKSSTITPSSGGQPLTTANSPAEPSASRTSRRSACNDPVCPAMACPVDLVVAGKRLPYLGAHRLQDRHERRQRSLALLRGEAVGVRQSAASGPLRCCEEKPGSCSRSCDQADFHTSPSE